MNGTIESDVLDYLVDGKFKRIGNTPSLIGSGGRNGIGWNGIYG